MPDECCLTEHPEFGGCCCVCRYEVEDYAMRSVEVKGWACVAFLLIYQERGVYTSPLMHGYCELFARIKETANA